MNAKIGVSVSAAIYEGVVANAVLSDIAPSAAADHGMSVIDSVVAEIVGTKNTRQGPRPNDASIALMRTTAAAYMAEGRPIPALLASAAIKMPIGGGIGGPDLAEVLAYRMLADIDRRVRWHYPAGMQFRFRMEDTTERVISDDVLGLERSIASYVDGTRQIVRALELDTIIELVPESSMADEVLVISHARRMVPTFAQYLRESRELPDEHHAALLSYAALQPLGWRGVVGRELRDYFRVRFMANYQTYSVETCELLIAKYLSCIAARYRYGMTGRDQSWVNGFFKLAFNPAASPPLPGEATASTTVHIRTVSRHITSNHLTPWVARGAVCRTPEGARIRLLNWHDKRPLQVIYATLESSRGRAVVPVTLDEGGA